MTLTGIALILALATCSSPTAPDVDQAQQTGWFLQNPMPRAKHGLNSVSFRNSNIGIAVGDAGTILRTTDGGSTWVSLTSGTANFLFGVSFIDANTGTAVGQSGTILRTTDGGGL